MAVHQVNKIQTQAFERAIDGLAQVLTIEGVFFVRSRTVLV